MERLLARLDDSAIDDAGGEGRDLSSRHGDHHLVQQRHALGHLAKQDQRLSSAQPAERHQVGVGKAGANPRGLVGGGVSARHVSRVDPRECVRHQQVAALHAVLLGVVEQPPGPGEPATAARFLALEQQRQTQPERAPRRSTRFAPVQVLVVRSHPGIGTRIVPAEQLCSYRQPLQILDLEWRFPISRRELDVGGAPVLLAKRCTTSSERVSGHGTPRIVRGPACSMPIMRPSRPCTSLPVYGKEAERGFRPVSDVAMA